MDSKRQRLMTAAAQAAAVVSLRGVEGAAVVAGADVASAAAPGEVPVACTALGT